MKTLSQRLEDLAAREYVVEVGPHGTVVDDAFDADTQELIREASALARMVEEAPVHTVSWSDEAAGYVINLPGAGGPDKRVRIVEE